VNAVDLATGFGVASLVRTLCWGLVTAMWWFAMDSVVDDSGVRAQGGLFRQRIASSDVARFALDRDSKFLLVLTSGRRKHLSYVPHGAWEQVQKGWLHATQDAAKAAPIGDGGVGMSCSVGSSERGPRDQAGGRSWA